MAQPFTLQSSYAGMAQDYSRDEMPPTSLWNLVDYIPNVLGAPLRKRGGWVNASSSLSVRKVMYGLMDSGGAKLLAIDATTGTSAGQSLYSINETTGATTLIGSVTAASAGSAATSSAGVPTSIVGKPVFYGKQWFIPVGYSDSYVSAGAITATSSMNAAVYDGATLAKVSVNASSGGASGARHAAVFRNRVALGNTPYSPRRIWWNIAGDRKATKFTDNHAWMDVPVHIQGMVGLPTVMLVWGLDKTIRIRGSIPPPGSDFVVDELTDQGCADARSISTWSGKAVWANTNGVFLTDGIQTIDLTQQAGMSNYYRTLLASFTTAWRLAGYVYRGYYFLSIADASGAFVDCLVCDLRGRSFFRLSNMNIHDYAVGTGSAFQQFYAANAGSTRVIRLTDIFSPAAANKNDGDGTAVLPVVEYPTRRGFLRIMRRWVPTNGLTHWKRFYLTYDLRDAATDNPTLQIGYVETPEASSYTTLADTLGESTAQDRGPFDFGPVGERNGKIVDGLGLKITQTAASSDTRIYGLEGEYEAVESSRLV